MSNFAPIIEINPFDLENLIEFISKHEKILKEFGGIKIQLNFECQLALKKYYTPPICSTTQIITKISGNKVLDHIVSCLTRSSGPGGIYPLSNNEQELFSLVYHHQGGPRHWLIIPAYQREYLRKIVNEENSLICLEHGQLLIDPLFLDKHHIKYHKLIQRPNEFIILSAGILSQSFTEDSSWSESIPFALPSWIQQGYAFPSRSHSQCNLHLFASSIPIHLNLLENEFILQYLDTSTNQQNLPIDQNINLPLINQNFMEDVDTTVIKHEPLSSLLIVPPMYSSFLIQDEEDNSQEEIGSDRNNTTNEASFLTTSNESNLDKHFSELSPTYRNQSSQIATLMETTEMSGDIETSSEQRSSFENLMDTTDSTSLTTWSTPTKQEDLIDRVGEYQGNILKSSSSISTNTITSNIFVKNNIKKRKINPIEKREKILIVTGLREDINKTDLYDHFLRSTKVTIKQCQTSSLKYAFVEHKTREQAKSNFLRPINYIRLGSECVVKYAGDTSFLSGDGRFYNKQTIVITNIPENVSEDDLRHLFPNSRVSNYGPAKIVRRKSISIESSGKIKTLWG
ncbi:unnamed protein product [Adineta steineri]|uniref:JmjC domain-containing protein n=1 Tax=Adineta steineri TaxID=433720 RepID=A0A814H145_9BILA|nr:unnamed protein product [Adineta steineri]CAF1104499.1 unnamed protein product [Adineta steineri]